MSNSYFQFKNFIVYQDKTAMKVCTDACLFGAWVASIVEAEVEKFKSVLDIGAGTGLLSLMLAQKSKANVYSIEIDACAAQQARENFEQSMFRDRLQLIRGDIRSFSKEAKFDLVISNPPFYENDLKSTQSNRNLALHSAALTFEELIISAKKVLNPRGLCAVLLPYSRTEEFIKLASNHSLFLQEEVLVKQTERHNYFRSMLLFSTEINNTAAYQVTVKNQGRYSDQFIAFLKDYYLFL